MPDRLQVLFDFHTASTESQLGLTKSVRDAALQQVESNEWGGWGDHNVRVVKTVDGSCNMPRESIARVVHLELDVPWFLHLHQRQLRNQRFPTIQV